MSDETPNPDDDFDIDTPESVDPAPLIAGVLVLPKIPLAHTQNVEGRDLRPGQEGYNVVTAIHDVMAMKREADEASAQASANINALTRLKAVRVGSSQREQYLVDRANEKRVAKAKMTQKAQLQEVLKDLKLA